MRLLAPFLTALLLFAFGRHLGGIAVGLLLGAGGAVVAWYIGALIRGRLTRNAPLPPELMLGEAQRLHGPIKVIQQQGPQACWAYLSDQRLSLLPQDGAKGAQLMLGSLDEIRPLKRGFSGGGQIVLVSQGATWRLQVPDQARWLSALQGAARKSL